MIKRKNGVDKNEAFKLSCENNNIDLSQPGSNKKPVFYIDRTGEKKMLNKKETTTNLLDIDILAKGLPQLHTYDRIETQICREWVLKESHGRITAGRDSCVAAMKRSKSIRSLPGMGYRISGFRTNNSKTRIIRQLAKNVADVPSPNENRKIEHEQFSQNSSTTVSSKKPLES